MPVPTLRARLPLLGDAVRSLTREEVRALRDAVARERAERPRRWPVDRRFWFDGTAGMRLSRDDDAAVREMWTTMNGWLAEAVTGMEIDGITDGRGVVARLDRLFVRRRDRIEGRAAAILERELGGDVWLASIAIWNALCAALLREHLPDALRADLESAWRQVRSHGVLEAGGDEDPRDMLSGVGDGHPPA